MIGIGSFLKQFWLNQNMELQTGVSEFEICAFERKHDVILPPDLRDYFLTVNGFADSDVDKDMITFLPLSEGFQAAKEWQLEVAETDSYFVFADFSISCHVYMISLGNNSSIKTPVYIAYDSIPQKIADSFTEFAEAYLATDYKVLFP